MLGSQRPNIYARPAAAVDGSGDEVIELGRAAGVHLDPWQELVLRDSLGEREDGKWAAFEVGVEVARQNGKGEILLVRELGGLFLLDEALIVHSAHLFDTSLDAFRRLLMVIEGSDDFSRKVKRANKAHGEEGIELLDGRRIRFRTRAGGGGRGFSADCLVLDEAMYIKAATMSSLFPTLSARKNPQVWYAGSAVDQVHHEDGEVFARVRHRARKGDRARLAFFGWEPVLLDHEGRAIDDPAKVTDEQASDVEVWAQSNPALGRRITEEYIDGERDAMDARGFAVERLNVGDWPQLDAEQGRVIPLELWDRLKDEESEIDGPVVFAFDVSPDRSRAAIAAGGRRADGRVHVEVVEDRKGTTWLPQRLHDLVGNHEVSAEPKYDSTGQAAALVPALEALGVYPEAVTTAEHAEACGQFFDMIVPPEDGEEDWEPGLHHLGTAELRAALRGAAKRPLGDRWAWTRSKSTVNIAPLVAATLAASAAEAEATVEPFVMWA